MNSDVSEDGLAVFGNSPAFAEKLHVGRPNIGDREDFLSRAASMLDRRWLTNDGPLVQELERKLERFLGVRHCVAMCNATVALEIAIRALDLSGEVIIPSYTFVATAHALQWQRVTPVFTDISAATHCIDPATIERMITPRTTGIVGVHLWGQPCEVDALSEIAKRRNLRLLFDAAHAFGCSHNGRRIGGNGDAEVFSFHATKFFNTLEGGAVTTNNDELAAKMRLMRNFGFAGFDNVVYVGTNGKMNEASAAMGLTNFESLQNFLDRNRDNWCAYNAGLGGISGLRLLAYADSTQNNHQYVVVEVDELKSGITRDELVEVLWAENVVARKYFWPGCHNMEPYRALYPHAGMLLPVTEAVAGTVMLLPTGTAMTADAITIVCRTIRAAVAQSAKVRVALAGRANA